MIKTHLSMARLQDVIASVLRDVLSAQHQANLLTESLADQYREAGVMHQLNLPAVTIGDLELSFRFAIEDTCELFEEKSEDEIKALDVIVDAEQLAELPESAIHNITLKVSTRNGVKISET